MKIQLHFVYIAIAIVATAALWQWSQNGRYVRNGVYITDTRTGEVREVNLK